MSRPGVDTCTRCTNYGSNLLANDCPANFYKTNVPCLSTRLTDLRLDTTCGACKANCRAGVNGSDPGQFISRTCDGKGESPEVQCSDCTGTCANVSVHMHQAFIQYVSH